MEIEGAGRTHQPLKVYSRRKKGRGKGKGISTAWGLAAAEKGETRTPVTWWLLRVKKESSPILKDGKEEFLPSWKIRQKLPFGIEKNVPNKSGLLGAVLIHFSLLFCFVFSFSFAIETAVLLGIGH